MEPLPRYAALLALALLPVLLVLQRALARALYRGSANARSNTPWRLFSVGEVLATALVGASAVRHNVRGLALRDDVLWTCLSALLGLGFVLGAGWLGLRTLLRSQLARELDRGNAAAGVAAAGHQLAAGLLASRALAGHSARELGVGVAFFLLALLLHGAFVVLFRALTTYDDAEQIEGENVAAAVSYAGVAVGVALVLARALEGDFSTWLRSLLGFAAVASWALVLYPVRQLVVGGLLLRARPTLRGGALDEAVGVQREVGVAALEAASYVAAALAVAALL